MEWLKTIALSAVAALAPIHSVMISVGVLIIFDLITGIWAAKKRGETIKSAVMRRTISKILIYQMAIITGFLLDKYLLGGLVPIVKIIAGVIGVVEAKSVLENANHILGTDLFKVILTNLASDNDPLKQEKKQDQ